MSDKISRRKFLKISGAGAAATAILTGCGPMARYVVRKPYYEMPEFAQVGVSTYYATTCSECPAGCGIIMRTVDGRAIKAEGNPNHPVSRGKICSRGLTSVQGLYNPDRISSPVQKARGEAAGTNIEWEAALNVVADALRDGGSTAFLLGLAPDHLYDLVSELTSAAGAQGAYRYSATGLIEGRSTLLVAMMELTGQPGLPYFDLANADLILNFGADFVMNWLSPVSYSREYGDFRRTAPEKMRGYMVSFEPRMGPSSGAADEWLPVVPGMEGVVARLISTMAAGGENADADLENVAGAAGVPAERLRRVAELWAAAERPVAIPGGSALSHANGLEAAVAILGMNLRVAPDDSLDTGQMWVGPESSASNLQGLQDLVRRMNAGEIQALFVHGVNPVFELPAALGFNEALANVPLVVSFSPFPDETAIAADYILPDHTGLESFGYQTNLPGAPMQVISSMQPVVSPLYNTRSTADVLLEAARLAGADLPYSDVVAFIQSRIGGNIGQGGELFDAPEIESFWAQYLRYGGWWVRRPDQPPAGVSGLATPPLVLPNLNRPQDENAFYLTTYATHLGDGSGANRPWLQETPDAMTTVTWNAWVEINPETAERLDIHHDDLVRVRSSVGEVELPAYVYPAIRPDTVAIPFGQGHTALGRYAEGRGANPMALLEVILNGAGELAYGDTLVTIEKTGRRRPLARVESLKGVYGEH